MSAAATARRTVMQPSTFTRPAIRSSRATIRRKAGDGVMSTRLFWTSADAPRRTTGRSRATFELAQQTTANESVLTVNSIRLKQDDLGLNRGRSRAEDIRVMAFEPRGSIGDERKRSRVAFREP